MSISMKNVPTNPPLPYTMYMYNVHVMLCIMIKPIIIFYFVHESINFTSKHKGMFFTLFFFRRVLKQCYKSHVFVYDLKHSVNIPRRLYMYLLEHTR